MDKKAIDSAVTELMRPTVFTGVAPCALIAEELPGAGTTGDICDAVWVRWETGERAALHYITRFAVEGSITRRGLDTPDAHAVFKNRIALPDRHNLECTVRHRDLKERIRTLKATRSLLGDRIVKGMDGLTDAAADGTEILLLKKRHGHYSDPFCDMDVKAPYPLAGPLETAEGARYAPLRHPDSGSIDLFEIDESFYGYFPGSRAELAGLQLKSESHLQAIRALEAEAAETMEQIAWLRFDDPRMAALNQRLPKDPYAGYFRYVKKGEERKVAAPASLVEALRRMIEAHMPNLAEPAGTRYIPIDNLLYLLQAVIPRADALRALACCDTIFEPGGMILGYEGRRQIPPRFLVALSHVAAAYQSFPAFVEACERY